MATQNVMVVCDFDMMFTFVYVEWEGTINNSRVLFDVLKPKNNFSKPVRGTKMFKHLYIIDIVLSKLTSIFIVNFFFNRSILPC